ncbi:MAG: Uma2 family endonuclease [Acidobacteria bacterium]|jgi:Uma2 family endonuclease|nr:Uma2 family endonuclease [Acidobacteriota bacterium]
MMNVQPQPRRLRFSVDDYYKMIELGMLKDYEKAEIIEGELIQKMPIGDKHAAVVNTLNRFFIKNVSDDILVSVQNPVRLTDYDEPEPDIVLADLTKYNGKRHPRPPEILLIVEVSDSTLKYDRDTKLSLYAEAEIPEVWIVNLKNDIIEVHQKPSSGIYQLAQIFKRGEVLQSESLSNLKLEVDKILG